MSPEVERSYESELKLEANSALDAISQEMHDKGLLDSEENEQLVIRLRSAVRIPNNEANRDLDVLSQLLFDHGSDLEKLQIPAVRSAIKERK